MTNRNGVPWGIHPICRNWLTLQRSPHGRCNFSHLIAMKNRVVDLNETNFDKEVLGASSPVMVQFWADWSAACKAWESLLESIAERETFLKVGRVNMDGNEALAKKYGVRAVPTLLLFDQGSLQDQIIGSATKEEVFQKLEQLSASRPPWQRTGLLM